MNLPFGLDVAKPRHFRDMLRIVWRNRDELPYAWRILRDGVCDGCALGPRGLRDDVIDGVHLCMTRLELLRLNTMPAIDPAVLDDVARLRTMSGAELRALGRLAFPMLLERGARAFRRLGWDEAEAFAADRLIMPLINEAALCLQEHIASPADIDMAMVAGTGMTYAGERLGPLAVADRLGLDVVVAKLEALQAVYGERFRPARLLRTKVRAGHLGQKSGRGFHEYAN